MVAKSRQFAVLNDRNQLSGIATQLARAAGLVLNDAKAAPAVGGGPAPMRDSGYGVINDLPPPAPSAGALNATAAAAAASASAATAPGSGAGRARGLPAEAALAAGAAALLLLL
jgi:hypothetical protein